MKTKIIGNTRYELEQHDNGKMLSEIKIPKGKRLLKPWEAQRLWDMGLLRNNFVFVENTNKELKKEGKVARFGCDSSFAGLDCRNDSDSSYSTLGVIFAEDFQ